MLLTRKNMSNFVFWCMMLMQKVTQNFLCAYVHMANQVTISVQQVGRWVGAYIHVYMYMHIDMYTYMYMYLYMYL